MDVAITDAGESLGVKTCIINPPLICKFISLDSSSKLFMPVDIIDGTGKGPFNQTSIQVPALIKLSLSAKQALVLGEGRGVSFEYHGLSV